MKKILMVLTVLAWAGCQTSDEEIRADIAIKAQQDLNFSGLNYTVREGEVNIWGHCPSGKAFAKIRQTISNIHVIKSVHYDVSIAPVILDTLTPVKLKADSLLAKYPTVIAVVNPSGVTLKGNVAATKKMKLLKTFAIPHVGVIKDSLSIR